MKHLVAGTAGHIDHGKSVLVKALTGIDTDRLPEEQRRGISIELGYACLDLPNDTRVGLVDVPGHERFVRTMVAGAAGIDFVILVVAADDSVMPQTREHLAIVRLLGVQHGLVALTKIDLVDPELAEVAAAEVRDAVADTFLADASIVPVSGITGAGIGPLRTAIADVAARVPERQATALARLPIDRSFTMAGHGAVVTGTLVSGTLTVGDDVEVLPNTRRARVRGIQSHGIAADTAAAGQRVALNLSGIKHDELNRGDTVCARGALLPTSMVDGLVTLDTAVAKPLKHASSICFHLGTSEVRGRLSLLDTTQLPPGAQGFAQLRLESPVVARRGDRFIIRTVGGDATLGGGQLLDAHPLKHRRQRADAAAALRHLTQGNLQAAIAHELHKAATPLRLSTLAPLLAERAPDIQAACQPPIRLVHTSQDAWAYDASLLQHLAARATAALAAQHKAKPLLDTGLTLAQLAAKLDPTRQLTDPVLSAMMGELIEQGALRRDGVTYALANHSVSLTDEQTATRNAILEACRQQPFAPPTVADLQKTLPNAPDAVAAMHEALVRSGQLIDGDVCGFHPDAIDAAWHTLEAYLKENGQITISQFREVLGTTRRYALALANHFDTTGRLVRDGDHRRLK